MKYKKWSLEKEENGAMNENQGDEVCPVPGSEIRS